MQGRRLAYRVPVGRFLRGVLAEGSATRGRRHVWWVSMPLFVPSDELDLSFSDRVATVSVDEPPALADAVTAAVRSLPDEQAETARLARLAPGPDIRAGETAAYASTYLGDVERALALLAAARTTPGGPDWVDEVRERLQRFEGLLREDGRAAAVAHLDAQAADTARTLGVG